MRLLISAMLLTSFIHAQSIDGLITYALQKHPSLQSIQQRLLAMDARIAKSGNWANPEVILNINDIQFDDPTNRSLEPMQYQAINAKQRFPWFGKSTAKVLIARAQKGVVLDSYDIARVKLSENIRTTAYTILEIKERLHIVREYEKITKQNIALYTSYTATDTMSHSNSMAAELMLSRLEIRKERYRSVLKAQEAKLAYLVQQKNASVTDAFTIQKPRTLSYYLQRIDQNPAYRRMLSQTKVAHANQTLKELEKMPDPFVQVGYFNRKEYPDYASVSVGFALPIYGSETQEAQAAKKESLAAQSAALDYKMELESNVATYYAKMQEAYRIYHIIQNESLPKLQHMFELNEASIQSGEDLFTYTSLLEQKLDLDEERTVAKAVYLRTRAQLKSLIGEIK